MSAHPSHYNSFSSSGKSFLKFYTFMGISDHHSRCTFVNSDTSVKRKGHSLCSNSSQRWFFLDWGQDSVQANYTMHSAVRQIPFSWKLPYPDLSIGLPDGEVWFVTPENMFPLVSEGVLYNHRIQLFALHLVDVPARLWKPISGELGPFVNQSAFDWRAASSMTSNV